jgi:hypothetical protein
MKLFEKMNCVGSASECGRPDPAGLCLDPCVNAISCEQLFRPPVIFLPTLELPRHVIYRSRSRPRSHLLAGEALTLVSWIPKGPYLPVWSNNSSGGQDGSRALVTDHCIEDKR